MQDEWAHWLPTLAGALHFCQLPAMLVANRTLHWRDELAMLQLVNQRIIRVIGGGIVLVGVGLGSLMIANHGYIIHNPVGGGLCLFLCAFWFYRGLVQVFVYPTVWPANMRWAHLSLCVLFAALTALYGLAFVLGLKPE